MLAEEQAHDLHPHDGWDLSMELGEFVHVWMGLGVNAPSRQGNCRSWSWESPTL
jgi:hypothetical protein